MSFRSINEIDKFSFDECQITEIKADAVGITMELEAVIVLPYNSQNTNYTKSYAGTTIVNLEKGVIISAVKEGFRIFDANDRLLEDHPDEPISEDEIPALLKSFRDCFLYKIVPAENNTYNIGIEVPAEDDPQGIESDIYRLNVSFEKAIFSWERYMNRVQE